MSFARRSAKTLFGSRPHENAVGARKTKRKRMKLLRKTGFRLFIGHLTGAACENMPRRCHRISDVIGFRSVGFQCRLKLLCFIPSILWRTMSERCEDGDP